MTAVQNAGRGTLLVERNGHRELALRGDWLADLVNLQRIRRVDGEQRKGVRAGLSPTISLVFFDGYVKGVFTHVHNRQDFACRRRLDDALREGSVRTIGVGDTVRSKAPGGNGPVEPLYTTMSTWEAP